METKEGTNGVKRTVTPSQIAQIQRLKDAGHGPSAIAKQLGMANTNVNYHYYPKTRYPKKPKHDTARKVELANEALNRANGTDKIRACLATMRKLGIVEVQVDPETKKVRVLVMQHFNWDDI